MKKISCSFEKEVLDGLRTGVLSQAAKEHTETCTVCQESMAIQRWMNRFQAEGLETKAATKKLPDAEFFWDNVYSAPMHAQCPDKALEKKALIPLLFPQVLAYAAALITIIYLSISNLTGIKNILVTKLELPVIMSSLLDIFKTFSKSSSYLLIPFAAGLMTIVVFSIIAAFENKYFHRSKQYIF